MRRVSKCYLLEDDVPFECSPVRICRTRRLAEHYKRVLDPKWEEAFGFKLRIVESKFYEDDGEKVPVETILSEKELLEKIEESTSFPDVLLNSRCVLDPLPEKESLDEYKLKVEKIIKSAVETERTDLGKSVLTQLAEQLEVKL